MGVPSIWDQIKPGTSPRISLRQFAPQFQSTHNRPLRVAIDGFMLLFEARLGGGGGGVGKQLAHFNGSVSHSKFLLNFLAKIRLFIGLNISFIIIFDGKMKPPKRRKAGFDKNLGLADFDQLQRELQERIRRGDYLEEFEDLNLIRYVLDALNITYFDSPGEAEAQASYLQREGFVDYVMSNDSDCLINGATKVLKNLSKFTGDYGATSKQTANDIKSTSTEYFITPVDMSNVEVKTGFTKERLLLYSILLGGDYNVSGVTGIGEERAKQLALSGTNFIKRHNENFPYDFDFSREFSKVYSNTLKTPERVKHYESFQRAMFTEISRNVKNYFSRKDSNLEQYTPGMDLNFPPDTIVMFYINPLILMKPFKFSDNTLNNAESTDIRLTLEKSNGLKVVNFLNAGRSLKPEILRKHHGVASVEDQIDYEVSVKDFSVWMNESMSECLLTKLITAGIEFKDGLVKIDKEKTAEYPDGSKLELLGARLRPYLEFRDNGTFIINTVEEHVKPRLVWLVKDSLPKFNELILNYEMEKEEKEAAKILASEEKRERVEERKRKAEERRNSPKKTPSPRKSPKKAITQSFNLASIGFISENHKSPVKKGFIAPDLGHKPSFISPARLFESKAKSTTSSVVDSVTSSPTKPNRVRKSSIPEITSSPTKNIIDLIQSSPMKKPCLKRQDSFDSLKSDYLSSIGPSPDTSPNRKLNFTKPQTISLTNTKPPILSLSRSSSIIPEESLPPSSPTRKKTFYAPVFTDSDSQPLFVGSSESRSGNSPSQSVPHVNNSSSQSFLFNQDSFNDKIPRLNRSTTPSLKSLNFYDDPVELSSGDPTPNKKLPPGSGSSSQAEVICLDSDSDPDHDITIIQD